MFVGYFFFTNEKQNLFERVTAVLELKGKKGHGWVLVSKTLTLPSAQESFDDFHPKKGMML